MNWVWYNKIKKEKKSITSVLLVFGSTITLFYLKTSIFSQFQKRRFLLIKISPSSLYAKHIYHLHYYIIFNIIMDFFVCHIHTIYPFTCINTYRICIKGWVGGEGVYNRVKEGGEVKWWGFLSVRCRFFYLLTMVGRWLVEWLFTRGRMRIHLVARGSSSWVLEPPRARSQCSTCHCPRLMSPCCHLRRCAARIRCLSLGYPLWEFN